MKIVSLFAICVALPAAAVAPETVWIDVSVQFTPEGARGTFSSSGAFTDTGSVADAAMRTADEVHVDRVMTGSAGDIGVSLNGNFVSWEYVPPTWCPAPPATDGTVLVGHSGNWTIVSGTGAYATLQGTGAWATWVVHDAATGASLTAKECLSGRAHFQQ